MFAKREASTVASAQPASERPRGMAASGGAPLDADMLDVSSPLWIWTGWHGNSLRRA